MAKAVRIQIQIPSLFKQFLVKKRSVNQTGIKRALNVLMELIAKEELEQPVLYALKRDLLQSLTNHHNPFHHVYIKRIPSDVRRDVLYMAVLENIKRPIRGRNGWIILDIISDIRGLALSLFQLKKCVLMQRGKTERKITIRALAILYIKIFLMAVPT